MVKNWEKVRKKPQILQWILRGIDAHKKKCVQVGALKMHDCTVKILCYVKIGHCMEKC
jgi:hypothetical protein